MRSRTPLVLMEQLILLLVFALAAAVCVRAFVLSNRISSDAAARDQALERAQNMAELWKDCRGDAAEAAGALGGEVRQGCWIVLWDANWNLLPPDAGEAAVYEGSLLGVSDDGYLQTASVSVQALSSGKELFTLETACQKEAAQ